MVIVRARGNPRETMHTLRLFTIATCLPVLLIGLGVAWGGVWAWAALGYLTVLTFLLDRLIAV